MALTKHGWPIPGTDEDPIPIDRFKCGGVWVCFECLRDGSAYHHPSNTKNKENAS